MIDEMLVYRVEILRRTVTGSDGAGVDEVEFVSAGEVPAWVEQTKASEVLGDRATSIGDWLVILPVDTTVEAYDRLVYEGLTLEVVGPPAPEPSLEGIHHLRLTARWIEG